MAVFPTISPNVVSSRSQLYDRVYSQQTTSTASEVGTPPPPCASTALSKHGVGVEPLFLGNFWYHCFCGLRCDMGFKNNLPHIATR